MRKFIITLMALLFVAAVAPAFGVSLFDGGTPVYAHGGVDGGQGHTSCAGGAHEVFGLGSHDGSVDAGAGLESAKGTDDFKGTVERAKDGTLSGAVTFLHLIVLCDTAP